MSYSQRRKDLERLADDYILGSDSDIRVVVGLDIEYKTGKKSNFVCLAAKHYHKYSWGERASGPINRRELGLQILFKSTSYANPL